MKYLPFFILLLFSCSKDSTNSNCFFIGKWCQWEPSSNDCLLSSYTHEFRANNEFLLLSSSYKWESTDCKTVNIISTVSGTKVYEYIITKISNTVITIEFAGSIDEYHKQ